jgi:nucleotide-binding universal stress UspA family protein
MTGKPIAKTETPSTLYGGATFARVLVGVDGSPESLEAARQAAVLATGELTILSAWDVPPPVVGGLNVTYVNTDEAPYRAGAAKAVEDARALVGAVVPVEKIARGRSSDLLLRTAEQREETLIAVGSHGQGRIRGIVMGSTATELVHKAPCSVLVTRKASDGFPQRVVVGVDGSSESAAAYAVAEQLAERFEAELWPVVAHGGKGVDDNVVRQIVRRREDLQDEPVRALVAASGDADLVVVGSRGLHGLKALGSVSERVAHQARCSVLVVRGPAQGL